LLSEDAANSTITYSLKSAAPVVNLGSGVTDSGKNAIYINSGSAALNVGSLAINGDVVVEVIGTISLDRENDGKADVTVTKSFELLIFDRSPIATPSITLSSGIGSGVVTLSGLDYAGRNVTKVTITVFSGVTTTKLATVSFVPGTTLPIGSGVLANVVTFSNDSGSVTSGLITYGADFSVAPSTTVEVVYEYKYYAASKEVVALVPLKQQFLTVAVS
jgi:hypothetical protein